MTYTTFTASEAVRSARFGVRTVRSSLPEGWRHIAVIVGAVAAAVLIAGCSTTTREIESPVTDAQAMAMAENALVAFNADDYTAWSRDWSEAMRSAIGEEAFHGFRSEFHSVLGDYRSISAAVGGQGANAGTYRWTFDVEFENGPYQLVFGFKEGSPLIEGVRFLEPAT
ncbi:MAG TPA: hypothetical protein VLB67_09505 [Acidimicrobiia bacterium]|nr:hypothetical protein [Acidimicrobiia bacterium]